MSPLSSQEIVDAFAGRIQRRLDPERLDGPVRLDNTRTVVIIPVKGKGPIHAQLRRGIEDDGVEDVIQQIQSVPSLSSLVLAG